MRNKKVILSSILSLVLCLSLIVGGTFALFTSESKTNISVNSGKVEVVAEVTGLALYSQKEIDVDTMVGTHIDVEGNTFPNGGTAIYADRTLTLDKLTPGDGVTFNISVANNSNVAIKYRTVISDAEGSNLMDALAVSIDGASYYGAVTGDWTALEAQGAIAAIPVSIELPTSTGNEYQDLTVSISITVEAIQGNAVSNVASVNGRSYETFADAIANAKSGDVVEVVDNAIVQMPANIADGVTVKGATFNTPVYVTSSAASIAEGDEAVDATADPVIFDSCTFKRDAILSVADRDVAINNCTFIDTAAGECAEGDMPYVYQASGEASVTVDKNTTAEVTIYKTEKWVEMANAVNNVEDNSYLTVKLGADLDLTGVADYQIKNLASAIDGQGHTISNLKDAALLGIVSGTVKNLNVDTVIVFNSVRGGANGFIGNVEATGLVENCTVSNVDIKWADTVTDAVDCYGGVINRINGGTVKGCEFNNINLTSYGKMKRFGGAFGEVSGNILDCTINGLTVTVTDNYSGHAYLQQAGGVIGDAYEGAVISGCEFNDVVLTADEGFNAAGIAGKAFGGAKFENTTVNRLTMTVGSIIQTQWATVSNVGGFIGQVDTRKNEPRLIMTNCHINDLDMTVASISAKEDPSAGFIASLNGGADITNCSVDGTIDGTNEPIGIGGFLGTIGGHGAPAAGYTVNITDCVANVAITGNDNIFVGGFVGYAGSYNKTMTLSLNFTNCEAKGSFYGKVENDTNEVTTFANCKVDGEAFNG